MPPCRAGRCWWADLGLGEDKRVLVVSNNARHRQLGDAVVIRLTTKDKPDLASIVRFEPEEMAEGTRCYALADDLWVLERRWFTRSVGALTPAQMRRVDEAIHAALDLSF
ncbi:MAG: type II toxin-antitoxin system PemK/MazF family toxin [Actinomycetota bacterium]